MTANQNDPTRMASQPTAPDNGPVLLSAPEIGSICTRAARGAGFDWGLAEEAGRAAEWLGRHRFDWARAMISRLDGAAGAAFTPAPGAWTAIGPICGLRAGAALADFASLPEGPTPGGVTLGKVLDPVLVLPFAARAARGLGVALRVDADGVPMAWVSGAGVIVAGNVALPTRAATLHIAPDPGAKAPNLRSRGPGEGIPVSATLWARLDALALGMTVPTSARSMAGAGAGGDDND